MILGSLELENQRENETMKGAHARFEPSSSKSLQNLSFCLADPLNFTPQMRREWNKEKFRLRQHRRILRDILHEIFNISDLHVHLGSMLKKWTMRSDVCILNDWQLQRRPDKLQPLQFYQRNLTLTVDGAQVLSKTEP